MKIAHIMYWYIPNMGYQENFLPAEQKRLNNDVIIITSNIFPHYHGINDDTLKVDPGIYYENGIEIIRLPILEIQKGQHFLLKGLDKEISKFKPDVVHSHESFSLVSIQAIHFQKRFKYKLFIDDHSNVMNFILDNIYKKIYFKMVKIYYNLNKPRIKTFLPVVLTSMDLLNKFFPKFSKELLPLGANNRLFKPDPILRTQMRSKFHISEDEIVFITSGKYDERKDTEILLNAYKKLDVKQNIWLILIGNGSNEYMDKLKSISSSISESNKKIHYIDFMKNIELNQYYNLADIGVWAGGPSIGAIEAMASGIPLIIPDDDKSYELLVKSDSVITFPRRDIAELTNAMKKLMNLDERKRIRDNGQKIIESELSWETIAKKSIEIYQKYD